MGIEHFPGPWGEPLAIKSENLARTIKYGHAHTGGVGTHRWSSSGI